MREIETLIQALEYLNQRQRAALRKQATDHINDVREMPHAAPAHIEPCDYAPLRRAVVTETYKRKYPSDALWRAGTDRAFPDAPGNTKSSVILPHKFL